MNNSISQLKAKAQLMFWRTASKTMRFALLHRRQIHKALTVAPVAIVAMAAFIIGRGLGLLIEAGVF